MKFKAYPLGTLCKRVTSGGTPKSTKPEYYGGDIPWLNTKEINFNRIYVTERCISKLGLENSSAKWIIPPAVIVAMYGATAGKVATGLVPLTTNQACCNMEINAEKADFRFIYYYLKWKYHELASLANGGAQQNLNAQLIKEFPVMLPSLVVQRAIAEILWKIDDKIETNQKINRNLEQQMQGLYQKLLTGNNCTLVRLEELASKIAMGPFGANIKVSTFVPSGVPIISGNHLRSFFLEEPSYNYITEEHAQRLKNSMVFPKDIIFTHAGNIGQVAMIPERCDYLYYIISQRQFYMRCDESKVIPEIVLFFFHSIEGKGKLLANANSTGVPSIAQPSTHLKNIEMPLPAKEAQDKWYDVVRPMVRCYVSLCQENKRLVKIRDTLLPKLMAGEIDISDIQL